MPCKVSSQPSLQSCSNRVGQEALVYSLNKITEIHWSEILLFFFGVSTLKKLKVYKTVSESCSAQVENHPLSGNSPLVCFYLWGSQQLHHHGSQLERQFLAKTSSARRFRVQRTVGRLAKSPWFFKSELRQQFSKDTEKGRHPTLLGLPLKNNWRKRCQTKGISPR